MVFQCCFNLISLTFFHIFKSCFIFFGWIVLFSLIFKSSLHIRGMSQIFSPILSVVFHLCLCFVFIFMWSDYLSFILLSLYFRSLSLHWDWRGIYSFFPSTCIVLCFALRYLIDLEFIILYGMKYRANFTVFFFLSKWLPIFPDTIN